MIHQTNTHSYSIRLFQTPVQRQADGGGKEGFLPVCREIRSNSSVFFSSSGECFIWGQVFKAERGRCGSRVARRRVRPPVTVGLKFKFCQLFHLSQWIGAEWTTTHRASVLVCKLSALYSYLAWKWNRFLCNILDWQTRERKLSTPMRGTIPYQIPNWSQSVPEDRGKNAKNVPFPMLPSKRREIENVKCNLIPGGNGNVSAP